MNGLRGSIAISDTRPPITAGPIERAFKFLKKASLSGGAPGESVAVGAGDAIGDATGALDGEGVSWAGIVEIAKTETIKAQQRTVRVVMRGLSSRLISVGQARRLLPRRVAIPRTFVTL